MGRLARFDFDFLALSQLQAHTFGSNWPVVYIIENGKDAYVGETTSAVRRIKNHLEDNRRRPLKLEMNQSMW